MDTFYNGTSSNIEELRGFSNLSSPSSVDWRDSNKVTAVRHQKDCGSCWAFATSTALESAMAIKKGTGIKQMSVQYMIDCDKTNKGCISGRPDYALTFLTKGFYWVDEYTY